MHSAARHRCSPLLGEVVSLDTYTALHGPCHPSFHPDPGSESQLRGGSQRRLPRVSLIVSLLDPCNPQPLSAFAQTQTFNMFRADIPQFTITTVDASDTVNTINSSILCDQGPAILAELLLAECETLSAQPSTNGEKVIQLADWLHDTTASLSNACTLQQAFVALEDCPDAIEAIDLRLPRTERTSKDDDAESNGQVDRARSLLSKLRQLFSTTVDTRINTVVRARNRNGEEFMLQLGDTTVRSASADDVLDGLVQTTRLPPMAVSAKEMSKYLAGVVLMTTSKAAIAASLPASATAEDLEQAYNKNLAARARDAMSEMFPGYAFPEIGLAGAKSVRKGRKRL